MIGNAIVRTALGRFWVALIVLAGALTASCYQDDPAALDVGSTPSGDPVESTTAPASESHESTDTIRPTPMDPTLTPYDGLPNRFIGFQGLFHVTTWDDRALTPEQKAADPWYNPAWVPFSECLAKRGLEVRPDASQKFSQADLDRLLERLNKEYPDPDANKKFPFEATGKVSGDAGIFFDCAEAWLTKTPQEIHAITGVPNMWSP